MTEMYELANCGVSLEPNHPAGKRTAWKDGADGPSQENSARVPPEQLANSLMPGCSVGSLGCSARSPNKFIDVLIICNFPMERRAKRSATSFSVFIYKVLKQVHPDVGISNKAMAIVNSMLAEIMENVMSEARVLIDREEKLTVIFARPFRPSVVRHYDPFFDLLFA